MKKIKRFFSWSLEWIGWSLLMALWLLDWMLFPIGWYINMLMDFNGRPPSKPFSWKSHNEYMDEIEKRKGL